MFNKKDYLEYFEELYRVEIAMRNEAEKLLKIIDEKRARQMLEQIRNDEIRHAELVKEMINMIS